MHLADAKIVEIEAQVRRHIFVGSLLMRQHDVQPDGYSARISGPPVSSLHDAGPAARDDHMMPVPVGHRAQRDQPREFPRLVIVPGQIGQCFGSCSVLVRRFWYPRPAEQDHGGLDTVFRHQHLWLQQFELQPNRSQFIAAHEVIIVKCQPVSRGPRLRCIRDVLGSLTILMRIPEGMRAGFVFHGWLLIARVGFRHYSHG